MPRTATRCWYRVLPKSINSLVLVQDAVTKGLPKVFLVTAAREPAATDVGLSAGRRQPIEIKALPVIPELSPQCRSAGNGRSYSLHGVLMLKRNSTVLELQFTEREGAQRKLSITGEGTAGIDFVPLGLEALRRYLSTGMWDVELRNLRVDAQGSIGPEPVFGNAVASMTSDPRNALFGLVEGGWLPVPFMQAGVLLLDSCVAGKFADTGPPNNEKSDAHLLDISTKQICPLLAAFEGGLRKVPTFHDFSTRSKVLTRKLKTGLPSCEVTSLAEVDLRAMYSFLVEQRRNYPDHTEFLTQAFPLMAHRVADSHLSGMDAELQALAAKYHVPQKSFLFLLALDCLYDEGTVLKPLQRPGRLVLKPKKVHSDGNLYNALFDVYQMEVLCVMLAIKATQRAAACTKDHGLAQAWAMLRPRGMRWKDDQITFEVSRDWFANRMSTQRRDELFNS